MESNTNTNNINKIETTPITLFSSLKRGSVIKPLKKYKHLDKILPTDFKNSYFREVKKT